MLRTRSLLGLATSLLLTTAGVAITATPAHAADGTITVAVSAANRPVTSGTVTIERWDGTTWAAVASPQIRRYGPKSVSLTAAPGTYRASFRSGWPNDVLPMYYGDGVWTRPFSAAAGTPGTFTVPDGGAVTRSIAYPAMREISGVITSAGAGEENAGVSFVLWDAASSRYAMDFSADTDYKGRYYIPSVPDGTYAALLYRETRTGPSSWEDKWVGGYTSWPTSASGPGIFAVAGADQVRNYEWEGLSPAPTPITAPSIPTTGKVGAALTVTHGTWTETPTFTYQWQRDGVAIPGARAASYTPTAADAGRALTVTMGATQELNAPGSATTNAAEIAKLKATVSAKKKVKKHKLKLTFGPEGTTATGKVKVFLGKKLVGKAKVKSGKATVKLRRAVKRGKVKLKVKYSGNSSLTRATKKVKVKVIS